MKNSILIETLNSLSSKELKRFGEFTGSSYFNKNIHVNSLAQFMLEKIGQSDSINKEEAFTYVYPDKKFDDLKIRHLMSMMYDLLKQFLVIEHLKNKPHTSSVLLLETFTEKNMVRQFKTFDNRLQSAGISTVEDYFNKYKLGVIKEQFEERSEGRRKHTGLQTTSDDLDKFYLISKLKQVCAIYSYQNVFKQEYQIQMLEEILAHLNSHHYNDTLISMYYKGFLTLYEPKEERHFIDLKKMLSEVDDEVSVGELAELHVIARNYCIKRLNTGEKMYVRELFDLYKIALDKNVLVDKSGQLNAASYKNIVAVGLNLKEFEWTGGFITEYSSTLNTKHQSDYLNYNLAKVDFEKEDYKAVIERISKLHYRDTFIAVDSRTLLVKTYYESEDYDLLHIQLESFKQFVSRRKELAYHRQNYLNLIKFTRSLMKLRPGDQRINKLKERIASEKILTEKKWLLDKLQEIE